MDLSIITGSRSTADNITSFYTFALGIIGGSFLVVGFIEFDVTHAMRGDLLRVYLAVITAMLGGGIGLFASRLGDRVADRRATNRKIGYVLYRIDRLQAAWEAFDDYYQRLATKHGQDPSLFQIASNLPLVDELPFLELGRRIQMTSRIRPDFDDLVRSEAEADGEAVFDVEFAYDISEEDFESRDGSSLQDDERHGRVSSYVAYCRHGRTSDIIAQLRSARRYFDIRKA